MLHFRPVSYDCGSQTLAVTSGELMPGQPAPLLKRPGLVSGLEVMLLHAFGSKHVALVRLAPGTVFQPHGHPGGEEIVVLEGVFQDKQGSYPAGSWLRNPPRSVHRPWSEAGCTIWIKTGHLPNTQGPDGSGA
ncbi:MAG: cupin domain-containing protein [Prochlorococcaceae cyanobacterium]